MGRQSRAKAARRTPALDELPRWGNLIVPWATRLDGELPPALPRGATWRMGRLPYSKRDILILRVPGWHRDHLGFLWQSETPAASPRPMFSAVSVVRQRRAMDEGLCQVCGGGAAGRDRRFTFLAQPSYVDRDSDRVVLNQAPVCRRCLPIARGQCPHLRDRAGRDWLLVSVGRYYACAVMGDVHDPATGGITQQGIVLPDSNEAGVTLARQRIVAGEDWRVEDE